jgi:hypothetical protein
MAPTEGEMWAERNGQSHLGSVGFLVGLAFALTLLYAGALSGAAGHGSVLPSLLSLGPFGLLLWPAIGLLAGANHGKAWAILGLSLLSLAVCAVAWACFCYEYALSQDIRHANHMTVVGVLVWLAGIVVGAARLVAGLQDKKED